MKHSGQATVEFALVVPFILLLIYCLLFFAFTALTEGDLSNAASIAAQWGAENPTASYAAVQAQVVQHCPWPTVSASQVVVSGTDGAGAPVSPPLQSGDYIQVKITYPVADIPGVGQEVAGILQGLSQLMGGQILTSHMSLHVSSFYLVQ